jgi:GDP-4-dehydro-6-deoxy-D-mannose reductase
VAPRVLVTGANGFVGRHLVRALLSGGSAPAITAWRRPNDTSFDRGDAAARAIRWRAVELLDRTAVGEAIASDPPDEVYHLAGLAHVGKSWDDPAATYEVNVIGTHVLLDSLRRRASRARVLVTGSAAVYAPGETAATEGSPIAPGNPYASSKLAQEMLSLRAAHDDGQAVLVVRPFNHVGPGQDVSFFAPGFARQIASIERGESVPVLRVGNLDARRDLTDVRDTVRAYLALMAHGIPGRPYNVCSGRAWRIREVLDAMVARSRVPVTIEVDPARLRPNDTPLVLGSFARLQADTGWTPSIPLEQSLLDVLDDARQRAASEPRRHESNRP